MTSSIPFGIFSFIPVIVFALGLTGLFYQKRNYIGMIISIEVSTLASMLMFIAVSAFTGDILGHIFVFFVLCISAAEVGIGLGILMKHFANEGNINTEVAQ